MQTWRRCTSDEPSIDARYTIDSTRKWLELAVPTEQAVHDQQLVSDAWLQNEPCQMTRRFLSALRVLHAGEGSEDEVVETARLLFNRLEVAAEDALDLGSQRATVLALLGILLDGLAELGWDELFDCDAHLKSRAAYLLTEMIWREKEEARIAAGILERLHARGCGFCFEIAAETAANILVKITKELDDPCVIPVVQGDSPLWEVGSIFQQCLDTMYLMDAKRAAETIDRDLLKQTSALLTTMLERTANTYGDEHLAELDAAATRLFDICCDAARGSLD